MLPGTSLVRRNDTHCLIPSKYNDDGSSVLARVADDEKHLGAIFELDNATNDRLLADNELLPGIGVHELVHGVPYNRVVNAAFTHAHPLGSRFSGPDRGACHAAFEVRTAQAEVAFHKTLDLAEVGRFEDDVTVDDYLADFSSFTISAPRLCSLTALFLTATCNLSRWPSGCLTPARSASSTRASDARVVPAWRVSGPRS